MVRLLKFVYTTPDHAHPFSCRWIGVLVCHNQSHNDRPLYYCWFNIWLGRRKGASWSGKCLNFDSPSVFLTFQIQFLKGLSNFHNGQAFIGGFASFAQTFVFAFFSYGGIELVAVAAGESAKPYKTVPRAIKATFFRILLFYILTILTIGLCINNSDPTLLSAADGECHFLFHLPSN